MGHAPGSCFGAIVAPRSGNYCVNPCAANRGSGPLPASDDCVMRLLDDDKVWFLVEQNTIQWRREEKFIIRRAASNC